MSDISEAKQRLPLPVLMEQEGLGEHTGKSARCPFHDDRHNSFSVWKNETGLWFWKCHAGCGDGDEITFLERHRGVSKSDATKLFLEMAGVNGATPSRKQRLPSTLDWRECVNSFRAVDALRLLVRRGYSKKLCYWLKENGLIGMHQDCFAFPLRDGAGNVVAIHYQLKNGRWQRYPTGYITRPMVIGELLSDRSVHAFESQWDAFAFKDKSGERSGIVVTFGAQNGKLVAGVIPHGATVYAWKQNDELKNGKRAGDEWLKDVAAHAGTKVLWAKIPERFKDLNEWTRAGATAEELLAVIANAEVIPGGDKNARSPNGECSYDLQPRRKSAATQLLELANTFTFFHDPQDRSFVRLEVNGHIEVWPVESSKFRKLLAGLYYKRVRKAINRNALTDTITTLSGRACHDSPEEPVFLRVAPHGKNILIDLCDAQWRVVEVTPSGWSILDKSPVAFVRTGSMRSLPEPVEGGSLSPLWELLNVTEKQRPLVAGALLVFFHPQGPYFVLDFVGEQGTAKSCAARISRQLVDPNENPLRSPPKEERDLLAQAASNWCVALDNLSGLPPWLSDSFCRLATGGGHSARTLYTDLEEISLAMKRPVILNGIEDVATRPDLAERVLQIELETIPEHRRITERELSQKLEAARPKVFSALLDGLVCACASFRSWRSSRYRAWLTRRNGRRPVKQLSDGNAEHSSQLTWRISTRERLPRWKRIQLVSRFGSCFEKQNEWSGEPAQLLQALNNLVSEEQHQLKGWPENARSLGHCLRRLAQALRRVGIAINRDKGTRRTIRLCKAREQTSETSASPENHVEKDIQDVSDIVSPKLHK
jgi:hypothetical protein